MAALRGTEIYDGDIKIAGIVREDNRYSKEGYVLAIVPVGDAHWKKYSGQTPDTEYIAGMYACSICSGCATANYFEPTKSHLLAQRICFSCDFWQKTIRKDAEEGKDLFVVVNGKHYYMRNNTTRPSEYSGFGGATWHIKFFDGREATCNNLWSTGDIPAAWRKQLPDNAEFVK